MLKAVGRILNIAVCLGFIALALLLIVVPLAMTVMYNVGYYPGKSVRSWLHLLQLAQVPAMHVFVIAWVSFVGSCFASFLNVVAWRVPRGKSILGSSHCPQCNVKLKFPQTNIPVLGWLRNGGRCANCDLPIPVRYLVAELVLGSTFLILFMAQTFSGGATIPFRPVGAAGNILINPPIDLLVMLGFHLTILSVIFTIAIAATEKFAAPISIVAFGILAFLGFQLAPIAPFAPAIVDCQLEAWPREAGVNRFLNLLESPSQFAISVAIGAAVAGLCFSAFKAISKRQPYGVFASLLLVGICFGWQAVVSVTILFLLISILTNFDTGGGVFLALLLHLCLWRAQVDCQWWPGPASGVRQAMFGVGYIGVLAVVRWAMMPPELPVETEDASFVDLPSSTTDLE